jgi:hypothetical protein
MDCGRLDEFHRRLKNADAILMLEITGVSQLPDVRYVRSSYRAFDWSRTLAPGEPDLLYPNTTTLVDVVLQRKQTDNLLVLKDSGLKVISGVPTNVTIAVTGRAELVARDRSQEGGTVVVR